MENMKVNVGEAGTHLWLQVEEKYPPSTDRWPLNRWLARPPSAAERESETMQCSAAESDLRRPNLYTVTSSLTPGMVENS